VSYNPCVGTFALAVAGFLSVQDPAEKTYDLSKANWKPFVGYQGRISEDVTEMGKVLLLSGEKIVKETRPFDTYSFTATQDILGADDEGLGTMRFAFARATARKARQDLKYGFHEKVVVAKGGAEGDWQFTLEGGKALEKDDLAALRGLLMTPRNRKKGDPDEGGLVSSPKPVKVGESWTPPVKPFAKAVMGDDGLADVELAKATSRMTLKAVSTRDGVLFGRVEATYELPVLRFGGAKLDQAILVRSTTEIDTCIDGKLPDTVCDVKLEIRGKATTTAPGARHSLNLEVDWTRTTSLFWKTVK